MKKWKVSGSLEALKEHLPPSEAREPHIATCQAARVSSVLLVGLQPVVMFGSLPPRATPLLPDPPGLLLQNAPDILDWIVLHGGGLACALSDTQKPLWSLPITPPQW